MRHVVIIGSKGQLGTDLQPALSEFRITGLTHADLDVCDVERAREVLGELRPDVVINTSAYHKVDVCEDEPAATFAVNATGAYNLARLAAELDFTLVHFSSDYVFDGRSTRAVSRGRSRQPDQRLRHVEARRREAGARLLPAPLRHPHAPGSTASPARAARAATSSRR